MVGGQPDYPDYRTLKTNVFMDLKYQFSGVTLGDAENNALDITVTLDKLEPMVPTNPLLAGIMTPCSPVRPLSLHISKNPSIFSLTPPIAWTSPF